MRARFGVIAAGLLSAACAAHAAEWISTPAARTADAAKAAIALDFRRELNLPRKPDRFVVQVSADQRFVLYVNGRRVSAGPARGDLRRWRYEEVDLAPYLKAGNNVVSAKVWSDGKQAALAQITAGVTAFSLASIDPAQASALDTGPGWQVRVDPSRSVSG